MREIDEILQDRPHLGILVGQAQELRTQLAAEGRSPVTASSLTAAELRLLPMLSTHLPAHEIAAQMYLSHHTVRSHVRSIYRKLGTAKRSEAVARARNSASWRAEDGFSADSGDDPRPVPGWDGITGKRRSYGTDGQFPGDLAQASDR